MFSSLTHAAHYPCQSSFRALSRCERLVLDDEGDDENDDSHLAFAVQANMHVCNDDDTTLSLLSFSEELIDESETHGTDVVSSFAGPSKVDASTSHTTVSSDVDVCIPGQRPSTTSCSYENEDIDLPQGRTISPISNLLLLDAVVENMFDSLPNEITLHSTKSTTSTVAKPKPAARKRLNLDFFPMAKLPDELICQVASFLNVGSLKMARLACRRFHRVLSRDEAGWRQHCEILWNRRIHICPHAIDMIQENKESATVDKLDYQNTRPTISRLTSLQDSNPNRFPPLCDRAIKAYRQSCMDARLRHEIRVDELLFDPDHPEQGTVWSFRFKGAAGSGWTAYDPWHLGRTAREMVFLPNGRVMQLERRTSFDSSQSTKHSRVRKGEFDLRQPFSDAQQQQQPNALPGQHGVGMEMTWRHVSQPMDLPKRGQGAYIRLAVGGRDVPTYLVHRSPNGNWGFLMENCWGVFASFPLPLCTKKQQQQSSQHPIVDAPLPIAAPIPNRRAGSRVRMRLRRASNGDSRWLNVSGIESDSEEEDFDDDVPGNDGRPPPSKRRRRSIASCSSCSTTFDLLDDSSLTVTNRWQWREALLFNLGAVSLPDGPQAATDFDREWGISVRPSP